MNKTLLKKMQVGVLSLMTIGLLAACDGGGEDTEDLMEDPATEQPAPEDPIEDPAGTPPAEDFETPQIYAAEILNVVIDGKMNDEVNRFVDK